MIKILFREYGANCKIVGIADGYGVAEDPDGLNSDELLKLVHESLPIKFFDRTKLSSHGVVFDATTKEGLIRRAALPFKVKADAFIPAGGRPNTINGDNWRQFLDDSGKPSSPLIVEGANIFNTPEARHNLFEHAGVVFVKDSSANKVNNHSHMRSVEIQSQLLFCCSVWSHHVLMRSSCINASVERGVYGH